MEEKHIKEVALEHQLEEWKILNEYLNTMDTGYQQSIMLVVSIFAVVGTVLSQSNNSQWQWGIFIIPLGLVAFFSYVSYQFRITAIIRGHLAALEESMNKKIHENVHMWNSALVEAFMAHNNLINKMMMLPIIIFLSLIVIYCAKITYYLLVIKNGGIDFGIVLFILYWFIVLLCVVIVFIPFLNNDKIRYETFAEDNVLQKYNEYKNAMNLKKKDFEKRKKKEFFRYEPAIRENMIDEKILKNSICLIVSASALGFGVLNLFWFNYSGDKALKGLYDYYAATIGDGICLPLLIGAGYYFSTVNKWKEYIKEKTKDKKKIDILGIIAVVIAIFVQGSWLISDSTELNWTIDQIHHFNLAGWYHAIYFVIMFWIITRVILKAIILNGQENVIGKKSYILIWVSILGYLHMHIIDDWLNPENYLMLIIICTVTIMILYYFFDKNNRRSILVFFTIAFIMAILLYCFCILGGLKMNVLQIIESIIKVLR